MICSRCKKKDAVVDKKSCIDCLNKKKQAYHKEDKVKLRVRRKVSRAEQVVYTNENGETYLVKRRVLHNCGKKLQPPTRPMPDYCEMQACKRYIEDCANKTLVYHHNHKTNKFIAWLCPQCNSAVGMCGDDPNKMEKVAQELKLLQQQMEYMK